MTRLSRLTLIFAAVFAILIVSPAFLNQQFARYPLMKNGDVTDILTPLILIPIYWLLFQIDRGKLPGAKETIVFLIAAAFWVEGQGMHLAANAIGHLTETIPTSDIAQLTHFFDEVLSHYLWHIGLTALMIILIVRQWKNPFANQRSNLVFEIIAGLIHGFNYFISVVEAGTVPLGLPIATGISAFGLIWGRKHLRQQPILAFFLIACIFATILFAGWFIKFGGFPQFSELGLIQ